MIIVDRSCDFLSVFNPQFSYSGMIDDFFNIKFNNILLDQHLLDEKLPPGEKIPYNLFTHAKYYNQIKQEDFFEYIKIFK